MNVTDQKIYAYTAEIPSGINGLQENKTASSGDLAGRYRFYNLPEGTFKHNGRSG
ncbi:MAG: hypothetical protein HFI92_09745 [Lachnospiraceae bacterium]|nr:hypothetical protein [Lachnospiraceae bacterium]